MLEALVERYPEETTERLILNEIRPWREELRQTGEIVVGFVDAIAESDALARYRHVPLTKRRAELALFYLWWIDKSVRRRVAGTGKEESCSAVLQALIGDFVPEMDIYGEKRWEMFSYLDSRNAALNVYAAASIQGMDPDVQDVDAVNRLVVYLAGITDELDLVWGATTEQAGFGNHVMIVCPDCSTKNRVAVSEITEAQCRKCEHGLSS